MPNFSDQGADLSQIFITEYNMIDRYVTTGSLWTWGKNYSGQLGDNTRVDKSSPVQTISLGTNWKQISAGPCTAAIKTDGTLWIWGQAVFGQIGDNTTAAKSSPVQTAAGGTNWKQVSTGTAHVAAIKTDGTLWLWGQGTYGQIGNNSPLNRSSPVQTAASGTNWQQVATGTAHCAAIKTDGTLWVWGDNSYGQLGDDTRDNKSSPIQTISGGTNWKQVSAGRVNTAAIKTDGTLWTWGNNGYWQLATGTQVSRSSPAQTVSATTNWKSVSVGASFMAAIKTNGTLWLWGDGNSGQLGNGVAARQSSPVQTVSGGTNWKQVSAGGHSFTTAIKTDGTLWTWGDNSLAQLGDNTLAAKLSPVQTAAGGTNWKQVSAAPGVGLLASGGVSSAAAIYFYDAGDLYPSK